MHILVINFYRTIVSDFAYIRNRMCKTAKKYLSLFFFSLFLFPYMQKEIHDLERPSAIHCTDKSSAHLHELSHTCSLCDYNIGKTITPVDPSEFGLVQVSSSFLFSEIEATSFESVKYLFLLRAPPVLS